MVTEGVTATEAKVETGMTNYELVVIFTPAIPEENLDASLDSLTKTITGKGGVIAGVDKWGKKKLAYPIKQHLEGHYVLVRFALKPSMGKELEGSLRIMEEIMRYLLIKVE
ncbi:MAG: 30S ribosomal protein S6 [Chloroflexi bacterium]|nr:30S ribosomal protein S6 [Chloroflexota bacterium]